MRRIDLLLLLTLNLLIIHPSSAQSYKKLVSRADSFYRQKDYESSLKLYKQAFVISKEDFNDLYNGACTASLTGNRRLALEWLSLSIEKGWTNAGHLKEDSDLNNLHNSKGWSKLIIKLQRITDSMEAKYDKPLKKELESIFSADQSLRYKYIAATEKSLSSPYVDSLRRAILFTDSVNLVKVTSILDTEGWPGKEKVGEKGCQALFLVIQHSDLSTQEKFLPTMRDAAKKGDLDKRLLAALEDRIAIRQGKKQIYGTQIGKNVTLDKSYVFPIEDPDNVDARRAEVNLPPIADYVKNWNIEWNVEDYKKQLPQLESWQKQNFRTP
jgi:tetratricopeptide (TPR) repeat protein